MIISILNLKGGAGKTTLATNLAAYLAASAPVLLLDTDAQRSSERWAGQRTTEDQNLTVVSITDPATLQKSLPRLSKNYKYIVIDGAPQLDALNAVCIAGSNTIILPIQPSPLDLWATETMVQRIKTAQIVNPAIKACFCLNRYSSITRIGRDMIDALDVLELPLLSSKLYQRVSFADVATVGKTIMESADRKAKLEFEALFGELKEKEYIHE